MPHFLDYEPDDIDVRVAELITATHDAADPLTHPKVSRALGVLREHLDMDVIFVSQFQDGRRTYRVVESTPHHTRVVAGESDPLEESWCAHVAQQRVEGFLRDARQAVDQGKLPRLQYDVGTFMSTPITLKNGDIYGTLCCYSEDVVNGVSEMDLRRLQIAANLLAEDLHRSGIGRELELQRKDDFPRTTF